MQKATSLGVDPANAPVGLMPCFREMVTDRSIQLPGSPLIPLQLKPEANLEPSEALYSIKNSVCTLVTTNRFSHPFFLIRRICFAFSDAHVVVFAKSDDQAFALKQELRADCQDAWHLTGEIPEALRQGIHPRIRITKLGARGLSLESLRLQNADIVIAMDAEDFARYRFLGPVENLFNTQRGTFIQPGARLVGIIKEDTHIENQRLVWPLFGMRTFQLARMGKAYHTPLVHWFTRDKWDKSEQGLGKPSNVDLKSRCIWNNRLRNHSLLRQVKRCRGEAGQLAFVRSRYGNDFRKAVGLVVENDIHRSALMKELSGSAPTPVYTFDEIRNATELPSLLVRGDAGSGILPLHPQPHPTVIHDLRDQSPWFLRARAKQRQKAYLLQWFLGTTPYQNKLAQKHLG